MRVAAWLCAHLPSVLFSRFVLHLGERVLPCDDWTGFDAIDEK